MCSAAANRYSLPGFPQHLPPSFLSSTLANFTVPSGVKPHDLMNNVLGVGGSTGNCSVSESSLCVLHNNQKAELLS